ncbi:MAG: ATP-binding protein [Polyangiales bacterium]
MRRALRARFGWAGLVILLAIVITGVWSTVLFIRLGNVVDRTLQGRQGIIDLTAVMAGALEREDDALLLGVAGEVTRARSELAVQRTAFDRAAAQLSLQVTPVERAVVVSILADVATYRREGDALLAEANTADARDRYHREVNPLLRRAVAGCGTLREHSFEALRDAGIAARDEARQGRWLVGLVAIGALGLTLIVALTLARSVLRPIRDLTASVEAMRRGDFTHRVTPHSDDELGDLAGGFNRMAESLVAWESSNLAEVLRAKDTLEVTLAALPDPVIVVDPDGAVVSLNAPARTVLAAAGITQLSRAEALPASAAALVQQVLSGTPGTEPATPLVVDHGGERRTYLPIAVAIPSFSAGRTGAVAMLHDITEFVRIDTLRSELIAVTSHELKTPLTTLRMNLLLFGEEARGLSPRHREILGMAVQGCEELARTIERLLDLSRIEAGKLRLVMERIDLNRLVDEVVGMFAPRFTEAELALDVVRGSNEAIVKGDPLRLAIVLSNLLTNAMKYTPAGGRVTVEMSRLPDDVQVAVTDSGPGIPEDLRDRVFEKFFRVEHVRPSEQAPTGAGVGLYICRQIVEAHGGEIHCEAVPTGSRLAFRLRADVQPS